MKLTHELIYIEGHRPDHKLDFLGQVGQNFFRPVSLVFGNTYEALTGKEKFYSTTRKVAMLLISTLLAPLTIVITAVGLGLLYISESHSRLVELVKRVATKKTKHVKPSSPVPTSFPLSIPRNIVGQPPKPPGAIPSVKVSVPMHLPPAPFERLPERLPVIIEEPCETEGDSIPAGVVREVNAEVTQQKIYDPNSNPPITAGDFKFFKDKFHSLADYLRKIEKRESRRGKIEPSKLSQLEQSAKDAEILSTQCGANNCDCKSIIEKLKSVGLLHAVFNFSQDVDRSIQAIEDKLFEIQHIS